MAKQTTVNGVTINIFVSHAEANFANPAKAKALAGALAEAGIEFKYASGAGWHWFRFPRSHGQKGTG